ncbi:hypothetical protein ACET3X_007875 [Alternaria dauci]|uniref:Uncharacterized protein n=1 Tax=Alternaria dauci TaxID=48095 RepID=A0ABR3UDP2_9PLEO
MAAPRPPSENFTLHIIKVEMSCTGNLDTNTILIEDASLLRMFAMKDRAVVVDLDALNVAVPVFALEAAGPMPDNEGEEDTDVDFEMLQNAWKTCRLVWKLEKSGTRQANSTEQNRVPAAPRENRTSEDQRRVYTQQTIGSSRVPMTLTPSMPIGRRAFSQPGDNENSVGAAVVSVPANIPSAEHHNQQDSGAYDEVEYGAEDDEDFDQSINTTAKRSGTHKAPEPPKKMRRKTPAKPTTFAATRNLKPRNPTEMIWPTTIITTGTAGTRLRPLMDEMGQILTTYAQREEYMDLLEIFVRAHDIVDQHNLWARWMGSGLKVAMPMFKSVGSGEMDAAERKQMFERKNKARRGQVRFAILRRGRFGERIDEGVGEIMLD